MDFFDTETIHCNLTSQGKVGGNFGIAWSRVQNYACFHYLNHLEAFFYAIFQQFTKFSWPFRQIGRIINKSMWAGAESKLSSRSKACDFAALPCRTSSLAYAEPMHAGACPIQASALSVSPSVTSWRIFLFKEMH